MSARVTPKSCAWTGETGVDLIPVQLETMTYVTLESGETKPKTKRAYVQPEYKAELEAYLARAAATEPIRHYFIITAMILNTTNVLLRNYTEFEFVNTGPPHIFILALLTLPYVFYPRLDWATFRTWGFKATPKITRTIAVITFIGFSAGILSIF